MWVIKTRGQTFYVAHVECSIPWSTKETPDNSHTKGSIKIKNCLLKIDQDNTARLDPLSDADRTRIRNQERGITRIIWGGGSFGETLKEEGIRHSPFKTFYGSCGTKYVIVDILDQQEMTLIALKYPGKFRVLQPNEIYYRAYDDPSVLKDEEDDYDDDD